MIKRMALILLITIDMIQRKNKREVVNGWYGKELISLMVLVKAFNSTWSSERVNPSKGGDTKPQILQGWLGC